MLIGEHLHLDVARVDDGLFDVDFAIAEGTLGFAAGGVERRLQLLGSVYQPHALAAAASGRFQHHRIANLCGNLLGLLG